MDVQSDIARSDQVDTLKDIKATLIRVLLAVTDDDWVEAERELVTVIAQINRRLTELIR